MMAGHRRGMSTTGTAQSVVAEDLRLDRQHFLVKAALTHDHLLHPHLPADPRSAIRAVADIGCGTGVWLNDVARTHFADLTPPPALVGFDISAAKFAKLHEPGVQLLEHDCRLPFPRDRHATFDLVNIQLLVYSMPEDDLRKILAHAAALLSPSPPLVSVAPLTPAEPGGHLQWFEAELRTVTASPPSPELTRILDLVNHHRRATGLAT